jgi:hypothetical protein
LSQAAETLEESCRFDGELTIAAAACQSKPEGDQARNAAVLLLFCNASWRYSPFLLGVRCFT